LIFLPLSNAQAPRILILLCFSFFLAPARTLPLRWDKRGRPRPLHRHGGRPRLAWPPRPSADQGRGNQASHGEGEPVRVVVGAGLPSLVPFARGGWPFKNAKDPTCAPRPGWAVGQPSRAHQHAFSSFLLWWLEGASLRGRRSHSRPPNSHLLRPRVAGRDFPPGNTSGSLRRCCLEQCLEGGGRKALRPLGHTFLSRLFEQDSNIIYST